MVLKRSFYLSLFIFTLVIIPFITSCTQRDWRPITGEENLILDDEYGGRSNLSSLYQFHPDSLIAVAGGVKPSAGGFFSSEFRILKINNKTMEKTVKSIPLENGCMLRSSVLLDSVFTLLTIYKDQATNTVYDEFYRLDMTGNILNRFEIKCSNRPSVKKLFNVGSKTYFSENFDGKLYITEVLSESLSSHTHVPEMPISNIFYDDNGVYSYSAQEDHFSIGEIYFDKEISEVFAEINFTLGDGKLTEICINDKQAFMSYKYKKVSVDSDWAYKLLVYENKDLKEIPVTGRIEDIDLHNGEALILTNENKKVSENTSILRTYRYKSGNLELVSEMGPHNPVMYAYLKTIDDELYIYGCVHYDYFGASSHKQKGFMGFIKKL